LFGPAVRLRFTFMLRANDVKRLSRGPSVVIIGVAAAPMVPVAPRRGAFAVWRLWWQDARRCDPLCALGAAPPLLSPQQPPAPPPIKREVCHTMPPARAKAVQERTGEAGPAVLGRARSASAKAGHTGTRSIRGDGFEA
jgi:hypothetical protein